ncbi:MAG: (2Fe-2S) ferredoxin domain-containing protein [Victivallales bacterium]|nr:(2Fe-2S) ferredoxin domain-containing protein [Victivallales bacterium]
MDNRIVICMGSSCFARGNEKNLRIIEEYLQARGLTAQVRLAGSCCEGNCAVGPNIVINGEIFHNVDPGTMIDLLNTKLQQ